MVWPVTLLAKINPRSSGHCCWMNCLLFTGQTCLKWLVLRGRLDQHRKEKLMHISSTSPAVADFHPAKKILERAFYQHGQPRAFWVPHPFNLGSQQNEMLIKEEKDKSWYDPKLKKVVLHLWEVKKLWTFCRIYLFVRFGFEGGGGGVTGPFGGVTVHFGDEA